MKMRFLWVALFSVLLCCVPLKVVAQKTIIRDAEIETYLFDMAEPIFKAAGLNPKSVEIYLIQDNTLNAFVTNGQKLFLHTGMLLEVKNAEQLLGVIAHETGHIAGGHLVRGAAQQKQFMHQSIIAIALGAAAGVLTKNSEVGGAVMTLGNSLALGGFFSFTRTQESAADQAGLSYLDKIGVSATGLRDFFQVMEAQNYVSSSRQDPYFRTHPLTRERIQTVEEHITKAKPQPTVQGTIQEQFELIQAKLVGYLGSQKELHTLYKTETISFASKYAYAIAYYRKQQFKDAFRLLDNLISTQPGNPYLYELKAQILFETGKVTESLGLFEKASALSQQHPLILAAYAHALLESPETVHHQTALKLLQPLIHKNRDNPQLWHLLSIAYGKQNDIGMAALAMAEKYLLLNKKEEAKTQAKRALHFLKDNPQAKLQAEDILKRATRK